MSDPDPLSRLDRPVTARERAERKCRNCGLPGGVHTDACWAEMYESRARMLDERLQREGFREERKVFRW